MNNRIPISQLRIRFSFRRTSDINENSELNHNSVDEKAIYLVLEYIHYKLCALSFTHMMLEAYSNQSKDKHYITISSDSDILFFRDKVFNRMKCIIDYKRSEDYIRSGFNQFLREKQMTFMSDLYDIDLIHHRESEYEDYEKLEYLFCPGMDGCDRDVGSCVYQNKDFKMRQGINSDLIKAILDEDYEARRYNEARPFLFAI